VTIRLRGTTKLSQRQFLRSLAGGLGLVGLAAAPRLAEAAYATPSGVMATGSGANGTDLVTGTGLEVRGGLYVTSGGALGVGVTSPTLPLHVSRGTITTLTDPNGVAIFENGAANGNANVYINSTSGDMNLGFLKNGAGKWFIRPSAVDDSLRFVPITGGLATVTFMQSGNVGIGTVAPNAPFHVSRGTIATVTDPNAVAIFENANANGNANVYINSTTGDMNLGFLKNGVGKWYIRPGGAADDLRLVPGGSGLAAMTLVQNGNVGIGTTSPAARLDVNGDIQAASALKVAGRIVADAVGSYYAA